MRVQASARFDVGGACAGLATLTGWAVVTPPADEECSARKSSAKVDGLALMASGSAAEKPVASGWLAGSQRCIFVRKRGDRWFLTSLCRMLLINGSSCLVACLKDARLERKPRMPKARREKRAAALSIRFPEPSCRDLPCNAVKSPQIEPAQCVRSQE